MISAIKGKWKLYAFLALLALCVILFINNRSLRHDKVLLEQDLNICLTKIEDCIKKLDILKNANEKCIEREASIRDDEVSREAILSNIKIKQRTESEASEVIDDEGRRSVIERLNRPW